MVAIAGTDGLEQANPLPPALAAAGERVARDFGLPSGWLNAGPTDMLRWGLPEGFMSRVVTRVYGLALTIHFAGRLDQIHLRRSTSIGRGCCN